MKRRRSRRRRPQPIIAPNWGLQSHAVPNKRDAATARAQMARQAYADGASIDTIVRVLGMGRSTVYRVLHLEPEEPEEWTRALVLEAGWAYFRRYHFPPSSATWNGSLVRRDPGAWRRWLEGWAPIATPRSWRHWPEPRTVSFYWGPWPGFRLRVMESAADYAPVPVPTYRRRSADVTVALGHRKRNRVANVADELFIEAMQQLDYELCWGRRAARKRFGDGWADDAF